MIKRAHECPLEIFDYVQQNSEIDYFLVHLFETDEEYFNKAVEAVNKGREVILDNSLFELREQFNLERYIYWIKRLKPTYFIVLDAWKDSEKTIKLFNDFIKKYPKGSLPSKMIGVAQGNNFEDVAKCYKAIEPYCDKVAFNFDFSSYCNFNGVDIPNRLAMSLGRFRILNELYNAKIINTNKPHHLLGVGTFVECSWYDRNWKWIDSIDTCNPIGEALNYNLYKDINHGLFTKNPTKMCDIMHIKLNEEQIKGCIHNIEIAKKICR